MASVREILIRILTKGDPSGAQSVKREIEQLDKASAAVAVTTDKTTLSAEKQTRQLAALQQAMHGNIRGAAQLAGGMGTLGKAIGSASLVFGAAMAGWQAGLKIQQLLWDKFVGSVKDLGEPIYKTKRDFDELNKQRLDGLRKEIAESKSELSELNAELERVAANSDIVRQSKAKLEISRLEAKPPSPERDKQIAALEAAEAQAKIKSSIATLQQQLQNLQSAQVENQKKVFQATIPIEQAKSEEQFALDALANRQARGLPAGPTARVARMARDKRESAQESYDQEVANLKDEYEANRKAIENTTAKIDAYTTQLESSRIALGSQIKAIDQKARADAAAAAAAKTEADTKAQAEKVGADLQSELQRLKDELSAVQARSGQESSEAAAAAGDVETFRATGGKRHYSPRSASYRQELGRLEGRAGEEAREAADAAQAVAQVNAAMSGIVSAIKDLATATREKEADILNAIQAAVSVQQGSQMQMATIREQLKNTGT